MIKFLLSLMISTLCFAQPVKFANGVVEFLGLKKWNCSELVDTLKSIDPNGSLHACTAILTQNLNFADASVSTFRNNDSIYTIVTVIEPEESVRVNYRTISENNIAIDNDWYEFRSYLEDPNIVQIGIQLYGYILLKEYENGKAKIENFKDYIDINKIYEFWFLLSKHKTDIDKEEAIKIINADSDKQKRIIATIILSNFSDSEGSWLNLVKALRDPDQEVRLVANATLNMFSNNFNRDIDWTPVSESLHYLLNGTNLLSFTTLLDVLRKTNITSELGAKLLKHNSELILAYFNAKNDMIREKAKIFLSHIYKQNFNNAEDWSNLINN